MLADTFSGPIFSVLRGFPDAHPATKIGNEDQFIGIARPALRWMGPGVARRGRLPFAAAFGGAEKLQALIIIGGHCAAIAACSPRPPQRRRWKPPALQGYLLDEERGKRLRFFFNL